jgi:pyruvate,water dikinase
VCPDQYLISRDGVQVSKRTGKKMWLRRRGPLSGNTIQEKVPSGRVSIDTIAERDLQKFAAIAARIEYVLKGPQHVEWAVERGRIVITQSSPVVFSKAQAAQSEPLVGEKIAAGIGVSAGIGKGKTISFPELSAIRKPAEPSVLVTKTLGMELLPYIKWFSGIVAEQGGAGSCLASIGRELGIPMVTGIENAGIILAGKEVVVDGGTGGVYGVTSVQS